MGSASGEIRVDYSRTHDLDHARDEFLKRLESSHYDGTYYRLTEEFTVLPDGRVQLKAVAQSGEHEIGLVRFNLDSGEREFEWLDE